MVVLLQEVIEAGGYNLETYDDSIWLLSKQREFEELAEKAQKLVDEADEIENIAAEKEYQKWLQKD